MNTLQLQPTSSTHSPATSISSDFSRRRARRLLAREIAFIHNADFSLDAAPVSPYSEIDHSVASESRPDTMAANRSRGGPAYFAALHDTPLLSSTDEHDLFRRMNWLKYRANAIRSALDPELPDDAAMDLIEESLSNADEIRERLIRANLRLVASIARRIADGREQFEEFVSDGNLVLMKAVEKFDFARGYRFSTYATHAVQRDLYRKLRRQAANRAIVGQLAIEPTEPIRDENPFVEEGLDAAPCYRKVLAAIERELDDRERSVLAARFGLLSGTRPRTLRQVASDLGISKERVRQIQSQALKRVHTAVEQDESAVTAGVV